MEEQTTNVFLQSIEQPIEPATNEEAIVPLNGPKTGDSIGIVSSCLLIFILFCCVFVIVKKVFGMIILNIRS